MRISRIKLFPAVLLASAQHQKDFPFLCVILIWFSPVAGKNTRDRLLQEDCHRIADGDFARCDKPYSQPISAVF
jgi:hypothetical protein